MSRSLRCSFSPLAQSDLEEIADYIARDNPRRALSFIGEMRERCQNIASFPEAAPLHPEYGQGVRTIPFGRYVIFYTVHPDEIRVERVLSGWRNLPEVLN